MINAKVTNIDGEIAFVQFDEDDLFHQFKEGASFIEDMVANIVRIEKINREEYLVVDESMLDNSTDVIDFAETVLNELSYMWE